jgi:hypothetical protein
MPFLSLLFSDFKIVAANFVDYTWLILESVPATSFALAFLLLIISLISFGKVLISFLEIKNLRSNLSYQKI